jgi:hypothetical protein
MMNWICHLDDAARLHVEALNPIIPSGSYTAIFNPPEGPGKFRWEDAADVIRRLFPKDVENGKIPNDGELKSLPVHFDVSLTERVFGWKFKNFDAQVQSVVGHYLELLSTSKL